MSRQENFTSGGWWMDSSPVPHFALEDARCYVLSRGPLDPVYPPAGGDIDGVTIIADYRPQRPEELGYRLRACVPGIPVQVELSAAANRGDLLETESNGTVKPQVSGKAVLRALENGSTGTLVWAVFTSGR